MKKLELGIKGYEEKIVSSEDSAEKLGNVGVNVLSSPSMIGFMELTCRHSVAPYLEDDETTVGIAFDIKHLASAKLGSLIKCDSELVDIKGKRLIFSVVCYNDYKIIGQGIHQRYIKKPQEIKKY